MKRMSRHTVVVLVVALLTSLGGMGVAVVAFGQDAAEQDAGVPLGDFVQTTPRQGAAATAPTSGYTSTTPLSGYTVTTPSKSASPTTTDQSSSTRTTSRGSTPAQARGGTGPGPQPSRSTRTGPTQLAFTGAEPIALGGAGAALMLAGLALHLRRRKPAQQPA
jgi:cytoskeletal protein RodZ